MEYNAIHSWDLSPREAFALQKKMRGMIRSKALSGPVRIVAGADVAYSKADSQFFAAVVIMSFPECITLETATAVKEGDFPYIPGLLSFREGPALLEAFNRVEKKPDLVFFDGQGMAHPRRLGLASHMGLFLGIPSIGCAKSRLTGEFEDPPVERGGRSELVDKGEVIGTVLRTRSGVRPVFVSVGQLIDLKSAVEITLSACQRYRLPEPIRTAHRAVSDLKRETLSMRHTL